MAFLIKIGHIPSGKSTLEYIDIFGLQSTDRSLPTGIKKIVTSDLQTIVSLSSDYIKETTRLPVDQFNDKETDYPLSDCDIHLDPVFFDKLIFTLSHPTIILDDQEITEVLSMSIWHLEQSTAETLIKYHEVGAGKKIIFDDTPSSPT